MGKIPLIFTISVFGLLVIFAGLAFWYDPVPASERRLRMSACELDLYRQEGREGMAAELFCRQLIDLEEKQK